MSAVDTPTIVDSSSGLFGIVSKDADATGNGIGVIILNSGILHRVGPYRLHVHLGRQLASDGCISLRLDQSGKGDSEVRTDAGRAETARMDLHVAADYLRNTYRCERFVVIGLCSGADDILNYATDIPNLVGVVMLDGYAHRNLSYYTHRFLPKIFRLSSLLRRTRKNGTITGERVGEDMGVNIREWDNNETMVSRYVALDKAGVHNLSVFTSDSSDYYYYEGQLNDIVRASGHTCEHLDERLTVKAKHLYPIAEQRQELIAQIRGWLKETVRG